ncbi:MAG: nuclear transport factor 2 family protein [Weeksellaceae bacterium]
MKNISSVFIIILLVFISSCKSSHVVKTIDHTGINTFIDQWHHAAAVADEETFFKSFTQDGIYIGTDPTEHWTARELKTLFKDAFEKESAWAFTPHDRHIYTSEDGRIIWFDELLDTWMGPCRGSGVLKQENGQWKIAHYHLSVSVPNDAIPAYLKIIADKPTD